MKFIRKKTMIEGEELLYIPQLHWFYTVKHMIQFLPFFAILLVLWLTIDSMVDFWKWLIGGNEFILMTEMLIKYVFFAALFLVLVIFLCRIFLYLSTEYGVTNKRLLFKKGIFRVTAAEIPTDRIESIYCIQGILGRIFHYGNICISGVGGRMPVFYMVSRPYALRRKIVSIIEKNKAITVVHGDIPRVKPKPEPVVEQEPLYRYGVFVRVLPESSL